MKWLEVSLSVDGEMAEAVAEVLARYVPNGVVIESTAIEADVEGEGYPVGSLRVCGYLPVDGQLEDTRQRIEEALYFLGRIQPLPRPEFKPIAEVNWAEAWKKHYRPIAIGKRLIIIPAWLNSPDDTRIPIRIDPGMAFGTGTHPTTQLCLELLEVQLLKEAELLDVDIIDVGCGSGILSIAALKLGASRAFGVDTDSEAVTAAQENAANNGVADRADFAVGSVPEIMAGVFPVKQAPVVVANILASILIRLLDAGLGDLVSNDGVLILSGILEEQLPEMKDALQTHGFRVHEKRQIDDWVAVSALR
ncbi:MAG: 50S ribosomal protein L11 methyltransferase [Anaerolineales bacterium]|nr:50S ribosomal protein L11 methyltransferase [Anaerolineales bacterium]